jgi:hypothetical protein
MTCWRYAAPLWSFLQVTSIQLNAGNPRPVTLQDRLGKANHLVRLAVLLSLGSQPPP